MSAAAIRPGEPPRDGLRDAVLWAGALAAAIATHLALGLYLLSRPPGSSAGSEPLPAITIDMAPAKPDANPAAAPSEAIPGAAVPDSVMEPAPDVPDPVVPPPEPAISQATPVEPPTPPVPPAPSAVEAPSVEMAMPDVPPPAVVPPNLAVVLPRPSARPVEPTPRPRRAVAPTIAKRPPPAKTVVETPTRPAPARQRAAERAAARRSSGPAAGARAAGARAAGGSPAAPSGASAASSAAWRSQLNAYLQSRLRAPPGSGGVAGVSFSVSRAGQITSAQLSRSSGNGAVDGAALAVFRGSVPPPPAGYAGPLAFTIAVRVR